jgi:hypothetical protein
VGLYAIHDKGLAMPPRTQLDKIEGALYGNGREGIIAVVARIEEKLEDTRGLAESAIQAAEKVGTEQADGFLKTYKAINELTKTVEHLAVSVEAHHKTEHLSDIVKANPTVSVFVDWLKSPKFFRNFIIAGTLSFIALHIIATYFPIIWDWVFIFIGLPKLAIPLG